MHDVRNQVQSLTYSIQNLQLKDKNHNQTNLNYKSKSNNTHEKNFSDQNCKIKNNLIESNSFDKIESNSFDKIESNNSDKNENNISDKIENIISDNIKNENFQTLQDDFMNQSNLQKHISQNRDLDLNISFNNESLIMDKSVDEEIAIQQDTDNEIVNQLSQNLKQSNLNLEINKLINQSKNTEELLNLIKFVNYKINFLYHIELTFENKQIIKSIYITPNDILSQVSKMMKILFINKSNYIIIEMISNICYLYMDIHMFKQLICQIIVKLHDKKQKQIELKIVLDQKLSEIHNSQYTIEINVNVDKDTESKFIKLNKYKIFNNIIMNIGKNLNQTQVSDKINHTHKIDINQVIERKLVHHQKRFFIKKVIIKDDQIVKVCNDLNQIDQEYSIMNVNNGYIQLNLDDESNIQSMHSLVFSRLNVSLNCCRTGLEFIQKIMAVQSQYYNRNQSKNKPTIIALIDHVLDGQTGLEVFKDANKYLKNHHLDIEWVLVSSTEDILTLTQYKKQGFQIIQKPLSKLNAESMIYQYKTKYEK